MLFVDAHVHIYQCFDLNLFFNSAFKNFKNASESRCQEETLFILFVADWSNERWFRKLKDLADCKTDGSEQSRTFRVHRTDEPNSLRVSNLESEELFVIAGRKIITAENLEVLALCSQDEIPDGQSLEQTITLINETGVVPVVPWAVGKWLGKRGHVLTEMMVDPQRPYFCLCDNGNRPHFWRWPSHFRLAQSLGIPIISGSDPLHFHSEAGRTGKFGFCIDRQVSGKQLSVELDSFLKDTSLTIQCYGDLEHPLRFFRNQLLMQVFKKKWRRELLK